MSKMTVAEENNDKDYDKYSKLKFVEFLEMIGRVAHMKFKNSGEASALPLDRKIEALLDEIFPAALG